MLVHPPTQTNVRGIYRTHGSTPPVTPAFVAHDDGAGPQADPA
jgi:hypothetical protein